MTKSQPNQYRMNKEKHELEKAMKERKKRNENNTYKQINTNNKKSIDSNNPNPSNPHPKNPPSLNTQPPNLQPNTLPPKTPHSHPNLPNPELPHLQVKENHKKIEIPLRSNNLNSSGVHAHPQRTLNLQRILLFLLSL